MAEVVRVMIEVGPKGKKVAAWAPGWPGLERGHKTEGATVERLRAYLPRYAPVAALAGRGADFPTDADVEVVGRYEGTGSTDFWGISFATSDHDRETVSGEALGRELALMEAAWAFFDGVRGRVSAELAKGPRGGGRDRDEIVRHVVGCEQDWGKGMGLPGWSGEMPTEAGLAAYREAYVAAIRAHHAEGRAARTWPLRYLIRHTAYHALDHAWEMEDKDLTGRGGAEA